MVGTLGVGPAIIADVEIRIIRQNRTQIEWFASELILRNIKIKY
jgi:hypothetical protein